MGNLYNKDAILTYLLPSVTADGSEDANGGEKEGISSMADCNEILQGRVKGLRDVVEVQFEVDTEESTSDSSSKSPDKRSGERWICPITRKELGPNVKAVYLVPCGHVFAEEAIREMKGEVCLQVRISLSYPILIEKWGLYG